MSILLWVLCPWVIGGEVNLALNKSYTISPKPNYSLCTDKFDSVQLTDGKSHGSDWFKKSTVGWQAMSTTPEVVVDLGKKSYIDVIRVHSIGGGSALVEYPAFIAVLVGEDGKSFGFVRLMENDDLPSGRRGPAGKIPHVFVLKGLRAEGRFVKVLMQPGRSKHLFLDEIEVMGDERPLRESKVWSAKSKEYGDSVKLMDLIEKQLNLKEKITATIERVSQCFGKLRRDFCEAVLTELEQLAGNFAQPMDELFSAAKLAHLDRRLGIICAKIYREVYKKPYVCMPANPMEILNERDMPILDMAEDWKLDVGLWQGEYESAAINVINCTNKVMSLSVSVSPLTGPEGIIVESKEVFTVRQGVFVSAAWVGLIADALVLQNDTPFELEAGSIVQIWLTIYNPTLAAGTYKGSVAVAAVSEGNKLPIETVPININVAPRKFPSAVALNSCNWAYTQIAFMTKNILPEAARDLQEHYTSVFVVHWPSIPFPKAVSKSGTIIERRDFSELDQLIKVNSDCRTFLFYFGFSPNSRIGDKFGKWMAPEWKKAFSTWLIDWVEHLKRTGIGYDKFAMYPFDERLGNDFYRLAKLIKSVDPNIRIYANSFGKGPGDFMRFKNLIDIWCLQDSHCSKHPDWLATIRSFGKETWTYEALGPGKANRAYDYYRLMPWRAFKRGQNGAGFWNYVDLYQIESWNDTGRPYGYYGVVYGSYNSPVDTLGENIIPSRRWEAWREGIEDYQYLYELQKAIDLTKDQNPRKAKKAQKILDTQVDYVLKRPNRADAVYQARIATTTALLELTHGKP